MTLTEDIIQRIAALIDPPAFDIARAVHYHSYSPDINDPRRAKRRRIALAKARKIADVIPA